MRWVGGKLYSGGKDGFVKVINSTTLTVENSIDFGGVLIRAIDVFHGEALVGLRNGTIAHVNIASGRKSNVMESHSDGEVWGLSIPNDNIVITTADDN